MIKKFIFTMMALLLIAWMSGYIIFVINIISKPPNNIEKIDYSIIVLTGGSNRIQTGLELWQNDIKNLFITGVHPSVSKNDILNMSSHPSDLPECCLTLGYQATTTIENALEAKTWIENNNISNIILVTSNYHMDRALLEFKHVIKNIYITPYVVIEETDYLKNQNFWKRSFSEYHKFIFRYIFINIVENSK